MNERARLYEIKMKLLSGIITYEQAKEQAKPYITAINERGKEIAKKYNRRFIETSFQSQMR